MVGDLRAHDSLDTAHMEKVGTQNFVPKNVDSEASKYYSEVRLVYNAKIGSHFRR